MLDSSNVQSVMNLDVWIGDQPSLSEGFQPDGDILQILYLFGGGINYLEEITVI